MSSNDILFSRGVANATIVASGTKLAAGVIPGPLSAPLADVDFQVFGERGILIPISDDANIPSGGVLRYNPTNTKLEFATGSTWESVVVSDELSTNQLQYVGGTHYVANKKLAVIPGIGTATTSDVSTAVTLDIKSTEPHALMRNISSVEGKSSLFMLGGTGNVTAGAVNGFELRTTTNNTTYGSKLEINPIVQNDLSTTMKSVTINPHGTLVESSLLSITSSITSPTLEVRGSAHTAQEALKVNKDFIPGFVSAFTDSNKIATFSYSSQPVLEMLATSKVYVNGATGAVLALRAVDGPNPGYLGKFSQGGYTGTNMDGILVEISNSAITRNLAIFNGYNGVATVSAAKLDSTGTLFLKNNLSVGGTLSVGGGLSVAGLTRMSNLSVSANTTIGGVLSVSGLTTFSNLSVSANTTIGGVLSVLGSETITGNLSVGGTLNVTGNATMSNVVVSRLTATNSLSVSAINTSTITVQNLAGQTGSFGNLTVTGSTTFGSLTYTDLSVAGNLSVGGNIVAPVRVTSTISASGLVTCGGSLSVTSNVKIGGVLSVVGNATVTGVLNVNNYISADNSAKAWALFSNTALVSSFGINSFSRIATGTYVLGFTTALGSSNYVVVTSGSAVGDVSGTPRPIYFNQITRSTGTVTVLLGSAHATGIPEVAYDIDTGSAASIAVYSL